MTIEEIRKNAPPEATHYIIENGKVFYYNGMCIWFRNSWWFAMLGNKDQLKPLQGES